MSRCFWASGLSLLMAVGIFLALNNASSSEATGIPLVISSQTPLTCTTHTTSMTLTISNDAPEVGDRLWVTATLTNEGCAQVGKPEYRLWLEQSSLILAPESPIRVGHSLSLHTGETDIVTFSLRSIGFGPASLRVSASFEVHLDYPGPAYWASHSTDPITVNVPTTDTEVVVLHQAVHDMGCFPNSSQATGSVYALGCVIPTGHSIEAQIERFADAQEAENEFATRRRSALSEQFRCYPAYAKQESTPQYQQAWHSWLAERWIITAYSVGDSGTSDVALAVSEAVYRSAFRNHLFAACDRIYLPVICR